MTYENPKHFDTEREVAVETLFDLEHREFSSQLLTDPAIFEMELERLFARTWIAVAHESELPESGSYVTRRIGRDPVLVTRSASGFNILLNRCSHRGMMLSRADCGSTQTHTCPYHAWSFSAEGKFNGAPFKREVYGESFDGSRYDLPRARTATYGGIIFGCWDPDAPSLEEFLGDYTWFGDMLFRRTDGGMEVGGAPQRCIVNANWKVVAEGFFGDHSHLMGAHSSFFDIGLVKKSPVSIHNRKVTVNGHSLLCHDYALHGLKGTPMELLQMMVPAGITPELLPQMEKNLSPEQLEFMGTTPPSINGIFPTTASVYMAGQGELIGQVTLLRFINPIAVDKTELLSFSLVEKDTPQEFKDFVHRTTFQNFGTGGIFEADDIELWQGIERATQGVIGRHTQVSYPAAGEPEEKSVAKCPGKSFRGVSTDDNQWAFYERYLDYMTVRPVEEKR